MPWRGSASAHGYVGGSLFLLAEAFGGDGGKEGEEVGDVTPCLWPLTPSIGLERS